GRTIRRKSSSTKRLSPAPSTQTSYYSESLMSESYLGGSRGLAALGSSVLDDVLDSSTYWGGELSTRRRRGTGDTESSKINGLLESKTYDTYASSSGYSSEDDYAGHFYSGQSSSGSGLRTAASRVGSFLWQVLTSPVRFVEWLFSGLAAAWHRLTGTGPRLGSVPFSRRYPWLKRSLLLLLLLLLLAAAAYGAWYFYPYGLSTLSLPAFPWWGAGKLSSSDEPGAGDLTMLDQGPRGEHRLLARLQAMEKRFEALEAEVSRWELRQGAAAVAAAGEEPSPGDVLALLEGLVSRRDAGLKEHLHNDMTSRLQGELDALRAQVQRDLDGRLEKMAQASQEMEARLLERSSEWQSAAQEGLRGSFQQEVGKLEQEVAALRRELAGLKSDQEVMGKHVEGMLEQLKAVRADMEAQFPVWVSRFLLQSRQDGAAGLVFREDLQAELQALEGKILAKVLEDRRLSAWASQGGIGVALRQGGTAGVTEEQVHLIVGQALKRYSEDRVGLVDYALESAGASVINTRCSETYETRTALLSLFGIPLWYHSQSPRVILQPDVNPGNCWAFRGSQGFAIIRLSSIIRPTAVTLEHIPKALSPQGTIPSAPKDFAVYGLKEEGEEEGLLLGQFTYDHDGDPIQTFYLEGDAVDTYQLVELRVLSNWGHPEYTCIYRFRVHGESAH
ncbi:SUN2 protein, partial [Podilymbus podiceps]|nr:SUN2 protein [Podilymbus podiceps]